MHYFVFLLYFPRLLTKFCLAATGISPIFSTGLRLCIFQTWSVLQQNLILKQASPFILIRQPANPQATTKSNLVRLSEE
jgi:hypothetical protein